MAYTFSFDASVKLTQKSNLAGYLNHFAREDNEIDIHHTNESIDPSRTHENITLIYDENAKNHLSVATTHEQIEDALYNRWGDAINLDDGTYKATGKSVRKDAVIAFGMIMQIDPQYYKDKKAEIDAKYDPELYPDENRAEYDKIINQTASMMLGLARERFGEKNIVAMSLHLDETNPHAHFLMTPVTDDGRLSQKDFINAPKLKQMHGEFRKKLREKGYDIDLERRTPVGAKRLSEKDYKELQKAQEELKKLEAEKSTLEAQKAEFEAHRASEMAIIQQEREKLEADKENFRITQRNEVHMRNTARDELRSREITVQNAEKHLLGRLEDLESKLEAGDNSRASRMALYMQRQTINGMTNYEAFCKAEPGMIEAERKVREADLNMTRSYSAKVLRNLEKSQAKECDNEPDFP